MQPKPPPGISPMKKIILSIYFKRWPKINHDHDNNPLDIILRNNHIFIENINKIPTNFRGNCKLYDQSGKLSYDGGYLCRRFHGYGKLIINNNEYYEGDFINGQYCGNGTYLWDKYKLKYTGGWCNSIRNGIGNEYKNDKLIYNGIWINNMKNGICKKYKNNIIIFDGIFKNDKKCGYGKEYDINGSVIREGIWGNNEFIKEITDDELCIICFHEKRNIAFIPCGHFCICQTCCNKLKDNKCLVCRQNFKKKQIIYM